MKRYFGWLGVMALAAGMVQLRSGSAAAATAPSRVASPCATDSSYRRLAFWVGDWDVLDSTGVHYATQKVHPAVDGCAITIDWSSGGGNRGMGMAAFDSKSGEWKEIYVSNQLPSPSGVTLRRSDLSYRGAGVRFISMVDPAANTLARTRVTIMPLSDHRAMQLFEDSSDGGKSWHVVFKAEHRLQGGGK